MELYNNDKLSLEKIKSVVNKDSIIDFKVLCERVNSPGLLLAEADSIPAIKYIKSLTKGDIKANLSLVREFLKD